MRRATMLALAAAALWSVAAAPASAEFGLKDVDVVFTNEDGSVTNEAGSHPFAMTTTLMVNTVVVPESTEDPETGETVDGEVPEDEVKDLIIDQIPGFVGSQTAVERCSSAQFNTRVEGRASCPDSTAVGFVAVKAEFDIFPVGTERYLHAPVYNLAPSPGQAAKLGFVALNVPIVIDVGVSDQPPYNLVAQLRNVPQAVLFYGSRLTLWGNPAGKAHDSLRGNCVGDPLIPTAEPVSLGTCAVSVDEEAFLTLPRSCKGPLPTSFGADSWQNPGAFTQPIAAITNDGFTPPEPQGMTNCEGLNFHPDLAASPTTSAAESPSGVSVTLEVDDPGLMVPSLRAQADISKVEMILPEGVTVNPSAAEGMGVCRLAVYQTASLTGPRCPESSKLGSVEVRSPLLEEALEGEIFLAAQHENPFGSLIAFYMMIESARNGIFIKQVGRVQPNAATGRLVSIVEDIPELPFSRFTLRFREGPRAPLVTPPLCGTYTTRALLYPSSGGEAAESQSSFTVASGPNGTPCPPGGVPPFAPGFQAGSLNNNAGSYSPFYMRLTRSDGQQDMTRFDAILPPGVTGKIAGIPHCPEAAIALAGAKTGRAELAAPSCPAASRIGRVMVGAGVGPALTWVPGSIYLAGPFAGAPLSIVVITPAVAGPFDVGTVVTREALDLDPDNAQVEVDGAASDPIPHILEGIPLKIRDLRVYIDRPGFTLNPTSCDPMLVRAALFGGFANPFTPVDDLPVALAARYQAASCSSLPFKPQLSLRLKGATKRSGNPALRAELRARPGDANVRGAVVVLPPSQFIDNAHINNPCTRVQFNAGACPKSSILGRARAFTPLLDAPLEGPVYFRSNGGERKLPDLVAALRGQFDFNLVIAILQSKNARVRTKVLNAPDVPVSKFVLRLAGGKRGLLENSRNLCRQKQRANLVLTGHNSRRQKVRSVVKTSCKWKRGAKKRSRPSRGALRVGG